jgi:hypothetical protein
MFYDATNDVIVLFGGDDKDGKGLNDTWVYFVKDAKWEQVNANSTLPTGRSGAAIYPIISAHGSIQFVLFAGVFWDKPVILSDLWRGTVTF